MEGPKPRTKAKPHQGLNEQVFDAGGVLLEFLASPDEVGHDIGLIRGTMLPGVMVPLHSHREPELLYVLSGSLEVFRSTEALTGWTTAGRGDVVTIPGGVKHALRNSSAVPMTLALVTQWKLYQFFRDFAKPLDAKQVPVRGKPDGMQDLFELAAKYGYWLASPEENAAIGIRIG